MLLYNAKGGGLPCGAFLQRLDLAGQSVVAVIQITDLILQLLDLLLEILQSDRLPHDDLNEFSGAFSHRLKGRSEQLGRLHRPRSNHNWFQGARENFARLNRR